MGPRRPRRYRVIVATVVVGVALAAFAGEAASVRLTSARATKHLRAKSWSPTVASAASVASGPSAVGVIQITVSRTGPDGTPRLLPVTVRYPTVGAVSSLDVPNVPSAAGSYSLVVFAHGYDTSAATYASLEHDLASAGFVVAAPDFPYTSSASTAALDESDVVNQAADVSAVISSLTTTSPVPLVGHIATTRVGVMGHSDGGVTAAGVAYNTCCADSRIGAAVILSGAESQFTGTWFPAGSPPLLAVHGTADEVNPFASSQQLFDESPGPKDLVSVTDGSHLGPFTTDPVLPEVATLAADFLHAHLDASLASAQRLAADANAPGLDLVQSD